MSQNTFRAIVLTIIAIVWILGWIYAGSHGHSPGYDPFGSY
jgi:hypothetical protein